MKDNSEDKPFTRDNYLFYMDLQKYRVQSPLFKIILPQNNVLRLEPQTTQAVGDGYYIILQLLSSGKYTVHFSGVLGDPSSNPFVTDATYNLNVR
jgi:hypothetical protein